MNNAKIKFLTSMLIFGSIGIFVRHIDLPSNLIVFFRCIIGSLFLFILAVLTKKINKKDVKSLKENWKPLLLAGFFLNMNWLFLYKAFKVIPVSIAVILYYIAPIIVVLVAPFILKEKLTKKKVVAVFMTFIGLVLIVGIKGQGNLDPTGIIYGLLAAFFYAGLVISNQKLKEVDGFISSIGLLLIAGILMGLYLLTITPIEYTISTSGLVYMGILCIVHTGIACYLYFSSQKYLKGQEVAILSYLDPASALLFSAIFLHEVLTPVQWAGIVCILLGTLILEIKLNKKAISN